MAIFIGMVAVNARHQQFVGLLAHYRDTIYRYVPQDALLITHGEVSKLLNRAWGKRETVAFSAFGQMQDVSLAVEGAQREGRSVYFALLWRPFKEFATETAEHFDALLSTYPVRVVYQETEPYRFEIYRLEGDVQAVTR